MTLPTENANDSGAAGRRGRRWGPVRWALLLALAALCVYPLAVLKWYYFPSKPEFSFRAVRADEFSLAGSTALTIRGEKPENFKVIVLADFFSSSPACAGLQLDLAPSFQRDKVTIIRDQLFNPFFTLPPGYFRTAYEARSGKTEYELRIPWQVTHKDCEWRLNSLNIGATVDERPESPTPYILLPEAQGIFFWRFFSEKELAEDSFRRDTPPETAFAQCLEEPDPQFPTLTEINCEPQKLPVHMTFPQKLTARDYAMTLNIRAGKEAHPK